MQKKIKYIGTDGGINICCGAEGIPTSYLAQNLEAQGIMPKDAKWEEVPLGYELPPSMEELAAKFEQGIDSWLDSFAQTRKYRDIVSAVSYTSSSNPAFKCEALYLVDLRDRVWVWANAYMAQVVAGTKTVPAWDAFLAELEAEVEPEWPIDDPRIGEE